MADDTGRLARQAATRARLAGQSVEEQQLRKSANAEFAAPAPVANPKVNPPASSSSVPPGKTAVDTESSAVSKPAKAATPTSKPQKTDWSQVSKVRAQEQSKTPDVKQPVTLEAIKAKTAELADHDAFEAKFRRPPEVAAPATGGPGASPSISPPASSGPGEAPSVAGSKPKDEMASVLAELIQVMKGMKQGDGPPQPGIQPDGGFKPLGKVSWPEY